ADVHLVIRKASLQGGVTANEPGTVIEVLPDALLVSTGTGVLAIHDMNLKGRPHADGTLRDQLSIRCGARFGMAMLVEGRRRNRKNSRRAHQANTVAISPSASRRAGSRHTGSSLPGR